LFSFSQKNKPSDVLFQKEKSMFTPESPKEEIESILPEWHEPFPEPNTIPSGWNLSAIVPIPVSAAKDVEEESED
jgi:hypothetical protein